ncbi:hypothetical protein Pan161_38320 [Gimesia algae]|uniref:Uncharacterized protein n=1 Tax=Gimesia algae TaxID=2527971 RepID=A0A517VGR0_9PLAN|nr:hypothetical protein Pan161_38320 [Gimesia algae]
MICFKQAIDCQCDFPFGLSLEPLNSYFFYYSKSPSPQFGERPKESKNTTVTPHHQVFLPVTEATLPPAAFLSW